MEAALLWAAGFLAQEHIFLASDLPYQTQLVPLAAIRATLGSRADEHAAARKCRSGTGEVSWVSSTGGPRRPASRATWNKWFLGFATGNRSQRRQPRQTSRPHDCSPCAHGTAPLTRGSMRCSCAKAAWIGLPAADPSRFIPGPSCRYPPHLSEGMVPEERDRPRPVREHSEQDSTLSHDQPKDWGPVAPRVCPDGRVDIRFVRRRARRGAQHTSTGPIGPTQGRFRLVLFGSSLAYASFNWQGYGQAALRPGPGHAVLLRSRGR